MENCRKILIADDDQEDNLIMLEYFQEKGIADIVLFVENGQQALAYFTSLTEERDLPRLVVLDMRMPILDGVQTLTRMKQSPRLKGIPVIMLSTARDDSEQRQALSMGALEYLVKPVTVEEGRSLIERFASLIES
jgi:CheY-like chemotaxis protein